MKSLLIALLSIVGFTANAQLFEEEYKSCKDPHICLYCGDTVAMSTVNLTEYFKWKIEHSPYGYDLKYGKINFELYVDSLGHSCVISVEDRGLNWTLKDDFRKWLNGMTEWRPAIKNGKRINSTIIVQADTHREWFSVQKVSPASVETAKKSSKNKKMIFGSPSETGDTSSYIYANVESLSTPEYNLQAFLDSNLRYPEVAAQHGLEGTVIVSFIVAKDGKIEYVSSTQGLGGGCTEEAMRVAKLLPPWKPGIVDGAPVRAYTLLPITFELKKGNKKKAKN